MRLVFALSCLALLGVTACSLNPQPLPPDSPGDAANPNGATTGPSTDGGTPNDRLEGGASDASLLDALPAPVPPDDGGDTGGASDASDDGTTDAPTDAATD